MKKMIISLVILLLLGAVAFGFGYVPFRLSPGNQALLFSRTSGWDEDTFQSGTFAWRWQLLIPKNSTLYTVAGQSRRVRISSEAQLPSAELYRSYLDGEPSFEQRISLTIDYRISGSGLAQLAPMGLEPASSDEWYARMDDRLGSVALEAATTALRELAATAEEDADLTVLEMITSAVTTRLTDGYPEVALEGVTVEEAVLPDLLLYRLGRETYRAVQEVRERALLEDSAASATIRSRRDDRLEMLTRYGEILEAHPVLLEYLSIAAEYGNDPLNLDSLQAIIE